MLQSRSELLRPAVRWASQVAASVGATLAATLIWSAVPHPFVSAVPQPELTSGGKFAARATQPIAYDGLDTMPLPNVASAPVQVADDSAKLASVATVHRMAWDHGAPTSPARAARQTHPPVRSEARRIETVAPAAMVVPPAVAAYIPDPVSEAKADESFLQRVIPSSLPRILPAITSTTRTALTLTASAGDALMSRVVSQFP